ncbi:MAG: HAD family hydrolase [Candidatus Berkelbacteria bacterium]|nr:HAD family hydrolase [Candidatus Berkelbacteria bacterium]
MPNQIKAVIFDVDGVLVDSKNANAIFFQTLLKKAGYADISHEEAISCFHLPMWQVIEKLTHSTDQEEIKRIWEMGHDPSLRDNSLLEFPDQLENVLEKLHKEYKLAIVTSRIKAGMEALFSSREIRHLFDVVVTFEDYTNPKPHPEPLDTALKKLGVDSSEAIYIGDSPTDIEAAKAAGMRSIFLSREDHPNAVATIKEFKELLNALDELV